MDGHAAAGLGAPATAELERQPCDKKRRQQLNQVLGVSTESHPASRPQLSTPGRFPNLNCRQKMCTAGRGHGLS